MSSVMEKSLAAFTKQTETTINQLFLGWLSHHAIQIGKAVDHLTSFYMEQPCPTYEECLRVRKHTNLPFVLDENVNDLTTLIRAWQDHSADVVNIKISKFGGITKAKEAIELCTQLGIARTIEDTWGGKLIKNHKPRFAYSRQVSV